MSPKRFEKLNADDRLVLSSKPDNIYGLTIHEVQAKEAAYYLAHLSSDHSDSVDSLVVTYSKLTVKEQVVEIARKLPDSLAVNEGDSLSLNCSLSKSISNGNSRIKVLKDRAELKLSTEELPTRNQLVLNERGDVTFLVEKAVLSDEGMYTIRLDKQETKCKVKVLPVKKQIASAPRILKDLDTVPIEFANTEPFTLVLTVVGEEIKSEWFRDNKPVVPTMNQVRDTK